MKKMENIAVENVGKLKNISEKLFAKDNLGLTGMEISINNLAAGEGVPFVHRHVKNEELYVILSGSGLFYADGEELPVQEGTLIRVKPAGERALAAGAEGMCYICIQAEENSLHQYTMGDGKLTDSKASWMQA